MDTPLGLLLFGAASFLILSIINLLIGTKKPKKAYRINAFACILLSVCMFLVFCNQTVLGLGIFIAGAVLGLSNYSKSVSVASKDAATQHAETDLSEPLKPLELFSWKGWFKIVARWGKRNTLIFYVLFNLAIVMLLPLLLLPLGLSSPLVVAVIAVVAGIGVAFYSVAVFNQQIAKNQKKKYASTKTVSF